MIAENRTPRTLMSAMRHFDPDTAERYIESIRWPEGPVCQHCGSVNVGRIASRKRFQCRDCRKQFSLTTGTILEGTHLSADQWVVAVWMIVGCRNGVSSCEIARTIGCKQQSAWHLLHRVRAILGSENADRLHGIVEADSTLVGPSLSKMPYQRRKRFPKNAGSKAGRTAVHALRERRTGQIRAEIIPSENTQVLHRIISENVEPGSCMHTDQGWAYIRAAADAGMSHATVNHGKGEYVRDGITTNGCENFFACLRRALTGTYIRPSPEHLAAYVDEATFRFNVRDMGEWERFDAAMRRIVGKRLTYSELTGGAVR